MSPRPVNNWLSASLALRVRLVWSYHFWLTRRVWAMQFPSMSVMISMVSPSRPKTVGIDPTPVAMKLLALAAFSVRRREIFMSLRSLSPVLSFNQYNFLLYHYLNFFLF
jgi:hypothetical protein